MGVQSVISGEVAWHVEFDPAPSKILEHWYPGVPNYGDITKVHWAAVEPVDVLTGGFPCQDVSLAGLRRGLKEGTRSGLWSEFARAIGHLRPGLVVIENVRGLLSAVAAGPVESDPWGVGDGATGPALRALGAVLGDLADLGYDARWCGVRAADAGAPHGRFRVFVIAHPAGQPWSIGHRDDVQAGRRMVRLESSAGRGGAAHADGIGRGAVVSDFHPRESDPRRGTASAPEHLSGYGTGRAWHGWPESTDGSIADTAGSGRDWWPQDEIGKTLERVAATGGRGGVNPSADTADNDGGWSAGTRTEAASRWGAYAAAVERWERVLGRRAPSPTRPDGKKGAHRLNPVFVEWMMGLPEGWLTAPEVGLTRAQQLKALGNGVVPQQAALAVSTLLREEVAA
ncbi:DNA cytosine methyltransferase [Leifsonia sp. ZF2019]|nr:DNA cytosine methyltransferase [Leifsonia sp. ZF2019]